ncbi:MAG: hypothetical protein NTZ59_10320 [Bacteroidetes bacterium]|jgi:hypothetical protein|nr:hypothetical protein [Bacteroidota bacterium]
MYRNLILFIVVGKIFFSCAKFRNNHYAFIDYADTIKIFYNVTDSSFKPTIILLDKRHRDFFKVVLNSESEYSNCQATNTIKFYSKDKEIFEIETSIKNDKGCQFLIVKNNGENE